MVHRAATIVILMYPFPRRSREEKKRKRDLKEKQEEEEDDRRKKGASASKEENRPESDDAAMEKGKDEDPGVAEIEVSAPGEEVPVREVRECPSQ